MSTSTPRREFTFSETVSIVVPCADQAQVGYYWDDLLSGGGPAQASA